MKEGKAPKVPAAAKAEKEGGNFFMQRVLALDRNSKPLMPCRPARARELLRQAPRCQWLQLLPWRRRFLLGLNAGEETPSFLMNFSHRVILVFCAAIFCAIPAQAQKTFIDTPSPCHKIEEITGNTVYLKSPEKKDCIQTVGRAEIEIQDSKATEVEIWLDGKFWKKQPLQKFNMSGISKRLNQAEKLSEKMEAAPLNKFAVDGVAKAQAAADQFNSPEHQAKITKEQERLSKEVFGDIVKEYYPDSQKKDVAKNKEKHLAETERIYVFFSKSVPEQTLKNYIAMIAKTNDPNIVMVMRGFIGGMKKVMPTANYIRSLLQKDPSCDSVNIKCEVYPVNVQIDPLLFQRYHVEKVPMIVFANGVTAKTAEKDKSEGNPGKTDVAISFEISGDAPLDYMLERINVEAKRPTLEGVISKMRSGFYKNSP